MTLGFGRGLHSETCSRRPGLVIRKIEVNLRLLTMRAQATRLLLLPDAAFMQCIPPGNLELRV
jgi:hypothetical protein